MNPPLIGEKFRTIIFLAFLEVSRLPALWYAVIIFKLAFEVHLFQPCFERCNLRASVHVHPTIRNASDLQIEGDRLTIFSAPLIDRRAVDNDRVQHKS